MPDNIPPSTPTSTSITSEQAYAWFGEAVTQLRKLEGPEYEKMELSFFYPDKKLNKFSKYMALAYLHVLQPSELTTPNSLTQLYRTIIDPSHDIEKAAFFRIGKENTINASILVGPKSIEDIIDTQEHDINTHEFGVKERFQYVAYHEIGHALYYRHNILSHNEKTLPEKDFHFSLSHNFESQNTSPIMAALLKKSVFLNEDKNITNSIVFDSQDEYLDQKLQSKGLSIGAELRFKEIHKGYYGLSQEMFADCVSVLLGSQLGQPINTILPALIRWRQKELGNINLALETRFEDKDKFLDFHLEHSTSFALLRLENILVERRIDPTSLNYNDIIDLTQECRNYGLAAFMYEASLYNLDYKKYLECMDTKIKNETLSLFSDTATRDTKSFKNKIKPVSNNKISLDKLFDYLEPNDKEKIQERVSIALSVINSFSPIENNIDNKNSGYNSLHRKTILDSKTANDLFQLHFKPNKNTPVELLNNLDYVLNAYTKNFSDLPRENKMTIINECLILSRVSQECTNYVLQNKNSMEYNDLKVSMSSVLSHLKYTTEKQKEKGSVDKFEQLDLWDSMPIEPRTLTDKIKSLARTGVEPLIALKPQAKTFK